MVRIILWGGAFANSDDYTFQAVALKIKKEYANGNNGRYIIIEKEIKSPEDFFSAINLQSENSIRSLDVFTHGGENHLYMVSVREDKNSKWDINRLRGWRYVFHDKSISTDDLNKVSFGRFAVNAKVEFHACNTAEDPSSNNNFASNFPRRLFLAGETMSTVIGHTDSGGPIGDAGDEKTKKQTQDYRRRERAICHKGVLFRKTKQIGAISEGILENEI